ncbi:hypothetical protein FS837_002570 [Tulasnella sp. UAMH 9824]|nr:hypothetical protein FS837_002570 [Tulasnella sp. UAMH 9824]
MTETINSDETGRRSTWAQNALIDEVEQTTKHLRIYPRKVLESLSHLRIDRGRIRPLGSEAPKSGGNADVEAAILAPANSSEPHDTEYVAVKKLRFETSTIDDRALAPFAHEVNLLDGLSHANVVKIIGFVDDLDNGVAWMLFCWEKNGNLREFVRSADWELPERVSLLNILVNSENRAVVTDFGSARAIQSATESVVRGVDRTEAATTQDRTSTEELKIAPLKAEVAESGEFITMTGPAWTIRWAAPELLRGDLPGLESDVWAFGWICWEAVTGNFPFDEESNVAIIRRIVTKDLPTVRNNAQLAQIKMLCSLMEDCLRLDANERPRAMRCRQELALMDQTIPSRRIEDNMATTRSSGLLHALGQIELYNGGMEKALEYFRQSLEIAKLVGDERSKAIALGAIGEAYRQQDDHSKQRSHTSNLVTSSPKSAISLSVLALGEVYYAQTEYHKAKELYIQSRDLFCKIGDSVGFARSLHSLGEVYRMTTEYAKAEELYIQSRDLFSKIGDQVGFAHSVKALGSVYSMRSEYFKAEESYIQSRDVYSRIGSQLGFAQSVLGLGEVYSMRTDYSKAETSFIQSRDMYSKMGDQLGFAHSLTALGDVYRMRADYSKAEESYIQSRDLYSTIGHRVKFAQSLLALGEVYRLSMEYFKAEAAYIQSRDLCSQIGDELGFAQSAHGLGAVYRNRKEYSKAEESYIQARDLYSKIGHRPGFANSVKALGDVYRMLSEYSKAEESYIQARDTYSEIKDQLGFAQAVLALGGVYRLKAEYSRAEETYIHSCDLYSKLGSQRGLAQSLEGMGRVLQAKREYEGRGVILESPTHISYNWRQVLFGKRTLEHGLAASRPGSI